MHAHTRALTHHSGSTWVNTSVNNNAFLGHKMEFVILNLAVPWGRQPNFTSAWTVSVLKVYNMCPAEHGFWYLLLSNLLPHFEHIFYGDILWILQCSILIVWEVLHTFLPFEGYVHRFISKYKLRKHQLLPTVYYSKPTFNTQTASVTQDTVCPSERPTHNTLSMSQKIMVWTGLNWLRIGTSGQLFYTQ